MRCESESDQVIERGGADENSPEAQCRDDAENYRGQFDCERDGAARRHVDTADVWEPSCHTAASWPGPVRWIQPAARVGVPPSTQL